MPACIKCGNQISEKTLYDHCLRCGHPLDAPVASAARPLPQPAGLSRRSVVLLLAGLLVSYLVLQAARATGAPVVAPAAAVSPTPPPASARPTPTPATAKPTPTPAPTPSPAPNSSAAQYVDPRLLVADPKTYVGQNIVIQGKALNVEQRAAVAGGFFTTARPAYTWVQVLAQIRGKDSFTTESVVVELIPPDRTFLKDECYRLYGIVRGTQTVRLLLTGAEREVPVIEGYAHERVAAGPSNFGCQNP